MQKVNKKALYESIMKSVSKTIKKALNEYEYTAFVNDKGYADRPDSVLEAIWLLVKPYNKRYLLTKGSNNIRFVNERVIITVDEDKLLVKITEYPGGNRDNISPRILDKIEALCEEYGYDIEY